MEDDINMAWWCLDDYDALHSDDDGALHSDDDGALHSDDDGALAGWVGEATDHAALPVDGEQAGAAFELDDTLQHTSGYIHLGLV